MDSILFDIIAFSLQYVLHFCIVHYLVGHVPHHMLLTDLLNDRSNYQLREITFVFPFLSHSSCSFLCLWIEHRYKTIHSFVGHCLRMISPLSARTTSDVFMIRFAPNTPWISGELWIIHGWRERLDGLVVCFDVSANALCALWWQSFISGLNAECLMMSIWFNANWVCGI